MTWTNTGGGDHEGADWTPADTLTIAGTHYNIGTFLVTTGYTVNILQGTALEIYADTISVVGTIDGDKDGYIGGQPGGYPAEGPGAGGNGVAIITASRHSGGGGGGYGAVGGIGGANTDTTPGAAGSAAGTNTDVFYYMGSGGGMGDTYGGGTYDGPGGNGGGGVGLFGNSVSVTGTITLDGENGKTHSTVPYGAGGGGSGGGVLLVGCTVVATGTFNVDGGNGANAPVTQSVGGGGGGGGGRIKIVYSVSVNTSGITHSEALGIGGTGNAGGASGTNGAAGTYEVVILSECTSTVPFGQTFTAYGDGPMMISKVSVWVKTVSTSGDFTLKIWDSTSKSIEYASKTDTISSTGEHTFTFADWIRIPDGDVQYYFEINPDSTGDVEFAITGISTFAGGDFYRNGFVVSRFDAYQKIYTIAHVHGPTVYNTVDTTVKSRLANQMLIGAIHTIDNDNIGTVEYGDDFTTNKYLADYNTIASITHDAGNNELDVGNDGYITYLFDAKYPIDGIPTLTATINITSGIPTIQISSNGSTWYDIDTAIVNDTLTVYQLNNATNLQLDGLTNFYLKVDCGGTGTVTCSIKTFTMNLNIVTIDAENPRINIGAANTYKCTQDSDSGFECDVSLVYRHRSWA